MNVTQWLLVLRGKSGCRCDNLEIGGGRCGQARKWGGGIKAEAEYFLPEIIGLSWLHDLACKVGTRRQCCCSKWTRGVTPAFSKIIYVFVFLFGFLFFSFFLIMALNSWERNVKRKKSIIQKYITKKMLFLFCLFVFFRSSIGLNSYKTFPSVLLGFFYIYFGLGLQLHTP